MLNNSNKKQYVGMGNNHAPNIKPNVCDRNGVFTPDGLRDFGKKVTFTERLPFFSELSQKGSLCILLLILAFILNAFFTSSSPIQSFYFSPDANAFYMFGKCFASGMVPYVDFIDTKGPFLFVLNMVGYLLSPDQFIGIYTLFSLFTFALLLLLYGISREFGLSRAQSLAAIAIAALFIYYHKEHGYGGRSENFIYVFTTLSLYSLVRCLTHPVTPRNILYHGFAVGLSTAAVFMLKWNYAPIPASIAMAIIFSLYGKGQKIIFRFLSAAIIGVLIFLTPFVIYFAATHTFTNFFDIYFRLTVYTITHSGGNVDSFALLKKIVRMHNMFRLLIVAVPVYLLVKEINHQRLTISAVLLAIFTFYVCSLAGAAGNYYKVIYSVLMIFPSIFIIRKINTSATLSGAVFIIALAAGLYFNGINVKSYCWEGNSPEVAADNKTISEIRNIMSSVSAPKILYYYSLPRGIELSCGGVPSGPVWFCLNGMDEHYTRIHEEILTSRAADFVILYHTPGHTQADKLHALHYKHCMDFRDQEFRDFSFELWQKEETP